MSKVKSLNVYPSQITITAGQWYHGLKAKIIPSIDECCDVIWVSSDNTIATVNLKSGYVYAKHAGVVIIYAVLNDENSKTGCCVVNVNPKV